MIEIRTIDRNNEPFTHKNVKEFRVTSGVLWFRDQQDNEHTTNEEFRVTVTPGNS